MERIMTSGLQRRWGSSLSTLPKLGPGRGWGRVSPLGTEDGVMQIERFKTCAYEQCSEGAVEFSWGTRTYGHSELSNPLEILDDNDKDSILWHSSLVHKQSKEKILQNLQTKNGYLRTQGVESLPSGLEVIQPELLQGTKEWLDLRKNRITASAFGNVLGFWGSRRTEVWEEKIGIREPFAGNPATQWGSSQEAAAVEKYKEITGNSVDHVAFKIYKPGDEYLSWLGASPDGLITYKDDGDRPPGGECLGVLEVKCPHNKGKPALGSPWSIVPHYYMPQVQGLLEIFDREFVDFYVWTVNGSAVFRIERNPEYWSLIFRIMAEFWWGHVVPAKFALNKGESIADIQIYRPREEHAATEKVVDMSRSLAQASRLIWRENMGKVHRF